LLALVFITVGFIAGYFIREYVTNKSRSFLILNEAYDILLDQGLESIPEGSSLEYGMIRGMLQAYGDPYTIFVEPVQHELESNTLQGKFGGIGVNLDRDTEGFVVLYPFPTSPAREAGIQDGDRLLKINDIPIIPETSIDIVLAELRGKVNERVRLIIARRPDFNPIDVTIKREEIPIPSVSWHLDISEPRLGVVAVNVISASTPDEIEIAFEDLRNQGAQAFVLDLRNNSGGLLKSGVDIARLFLEDGVILQQQYRDMDIETFQVMKPGSLSSLPLVVLVNENTASASEIVAGALKANGRALLIGAPTFGKDSIQLVYDLDDGSSLHVTAARWWIPGLETTIQETGIIPDINISPATMPSAPDPIITEAIRILFGSN